MRGLTQKDPVEGLPAGELTEVAFVYDENSLYVAARLSTALTGRLHTRLSPRDDMAQTQSFFISLDTYHDHRTADTFGVTAAGVKVDFYHPADAELNQVLAWDPVWDVRTQVFNDHWIVEARIPFSQLRFNPVDELVFGLQIDRWTPERDAEDYWCTVPRAETGWASRFGELHGIRGVRPSRRLELLPYAGEARLLHNPDPTDPFQADSEFEDRLGGDLKLGLGPNLTLDATVNPDFGQVEADPAQLNLTAFETVLEERRPFFLEGDQLPRGQGPRYYYSRRIGAQLPFPALADTVTHVDMPPNTRILGAVKLSGRLTGGLSIAALGALTDEEHARIHNSGSGRSASLLVQPRTSSGVLRLQQEFAGGRSSVGFTATHLQRALRNDPQLSARLAETAASGGVDWYLRAPDNLHSLSGYWGVSRVAGDSLAIGRLQRRPEPRRPDPGRRRLALRTDLDGQPGRSPSQPRGLGSGPDLGRGSAAQRQWLVLRPLPARTQRGDPDQSFILAQLEPDPVHRHPAGLLHGPGRRPGAVLAWTTARCASPRAGATRSFPGCGWSSTPSPSWPACAMTILAATWAPAARTCGAIGRRTGWDGVPMASGSSRRRAGR